MNELKLLTDEQLVCLYSKGDNKAFDVLLSRYQSKIYNYIFFLVRNDTLADDLFQETFLKCISTIRQGSYQESGRFGAWLMRIAHNLVIDHFRQEKSENTLSDDDTDGDLFNRIELCEDNVETRLVNHQVLTDVRRLIQALSPEQREIVFMRYYQNLSFRDIAEATGVSINTALGRMRYALINMRRMADENHISLTLE